jgi:Putative adhesin
MNEKLPMTPGRWLAYALGVPLCLALVGYTGFDFVAQAGQGKVPVSYAFPAGATQVTVTTSGGNVVLRQVPGGRGSLTGTGVYSLIRPHVTEDFTGGQAKVGYECAPLPAGNCGLNAILNVPDGTTVTVATGGGDIDAVGTTGHISLYSSGGNVTASQVAGPVLLSTDGGDIQATAVTTTQVTADTGGGNIDIVFTTIPRDVQVSTDGGDVTIVVPPGDTRYHVIAHTDGGDVSDTLHRDASAPNLITATSGGGNITITEAS